MPFDIHTAVLYCLYSLFRKHADTLRVARLPSLGHSRVGAAVHASQVGSTNCLRLGDLFNHGGW